MEEPAVVRCAECGQPNADRSLRMMDRRFSAGPNYCRSCYEKLAARHMKLGDDRVIEMTIVNYHR